MKSKKRANSKVMESKKDINDKIEILEPDWEITLKVWWSMVWRLFGYTILAVAGFTWIPNILLLFGIDMDVVQGIGSFFGIVVSVPLSIVIVRFVLYKEYKNFKIAIIKTGHGGRRSQGTGDKSQETVL